MTRTVACSNVVVLLVASCQALMASDHPAKKLPVPSNNDLKESQAILRDIFKDDIQQATTSKKRSELAAKFLEQAVETKDDPTGRYALLQAARNLAVRSNDVELAMKISEELCWAYEVDGLGTKVSILKDIASVATASDSNRAICEVALELLPEVLATDDFKTATEIAQVASDAARKAKELALAKRAQAQLNEIEIAAAEYKSVTDSIAALEKDPSDPKANFLVGRFRCFMKGDWESGLPLLGKGDDATLKSLAEQDLAEPNAVTARVKLGDGWWALAEDQTETAKKNLQQRARHWYEQALPELSGLTKAKIEKRLAEFVPQKGIDSKHDGGQAEALQGNWQAVKAWGGESEIVKSDFWKDPKTLVVNGVKFTLVLADGTFKGTLDVDDRSAPKKVTFNTGDGGLELLGIFKFQRNELTVCWTIKSPGKRQTARPTDFEPAAGKMLFVFERQVAVADVLLGTWRQSERGTTFEFRKDGTCTQKGKSGTQESRWLCQGNTISWIYEDGTVKVFKTTSVQQNVIVGKMDGVRPYTWARIK